jgi:hypothetical protein
MGQFGDFGDTDNDEYDKRIRGDSGGRSSTSTIGLGFGVICESSYDNSVAEFV